MASSNSAQLNPMPPSALLLTTALNLMFAGLMAAEPDAVPTTQATVRPDPRTPYLRYTSDLAVGNKGEEVLQVSVEAHCHLPQWVFDRAELVIHRNRFGAAQFVALPPAGCLDCPPIRVRWYHEPTGHLEFSVNVFRRLVIPSCEKPAAAGDAGPTPNNPKKEPQP